MTRFIITLQDRLIHDNRDMRFGGRRGNELDWICDRTGEHLVLSDEAMAVAIAKGKAHLVRPGFSNQTLATQPADQLVDLSMISKEEKEEAERRYHYVLAAHEAGLLYRPTESELTQCIQRASKQLQDETPPSIRSVKRWIKRAGPNPKSGKLVTRHLAKGNRIDRLDPMVREIVEELIDTDFLARPPISVLTLQQRIHYRINIINGQKSLNLKAPSVEAVRDAVNRRDLKTVMSARFGKNAARQEFDAVRRRKDPEAPLDLVELDHTTGDLFVVDGDIFLPYGRPTFAHANDRCTRMPFGFYLGFEPPSVLTVLQCLHNGMLPKTYLQEKIDKKLWNIKHHWPVCGRPRTLLLDRAMENIGSDIAEIAGELGIHLQFAPRKSPWYKGAIERFLKTLNETLLHEQHGTSFGNILDRGDYDPSKNAVITIGELRMQVHRWMLDVYACGKHKGMRDVPLRKWEELSKIHPIDPIDSINDLNVLLGRTEVRKLRRTGISFEYIEYINDDLISFLSDPHFRKASPDCLIRFKYNPDNLEYIHVHLPHNQKYIRVESAPKWREYTRGLSIWQHRNVVKFENQRMNGANDHDGIVKAKAEISEYFNAIWRQRRGNRGRSQAARFLGHGRLNAIGSDDTKPPHKVSDMTTTEHSRRSMVRQQMKAHPDLSANTLQGRTKPLIQEVSLPNGIERNDEVDIYAKLKTPEKN